MLLSLTALTQLSTSPRRRCSFTQKALSLHPQGALSLDAPRTLRGALKQARLRCLDQLAQQREVRPRGGPSESCGTHKPVVCCSGAGALRRIVRILCCERRWGVIKGQSSMQVQIAPGCKITISGHMLHTLLNMRLWPSSRSYVISPLPYPSASKCHRDQLTSCAPAAASFSAASMTDRNTDAAWGAAGWAR